jgi:hypothetical protein
MSDSDADGYEYDSDPEEDDDDDGQVIQTAAVKNSKFSRPYMTVISFIRLSYFVQDVSDFSRGGSSSSSPSVGLASSVRNETYLIRRSCDTPYIVSMLCPGRLPKETVG